MYVPISEELLEKMVLLEDTKRRSIEYQEECTRVKDICNGWLDVTAKLQEDVVKSFGFTSPLHCQIAVNMLRRARIIYPENPVFKTPVYVANNKANKGIYVDGDEVPDVTIFKRDFSQIPLKDLVSKSQKTIILSGSHTWQPLRSYIHYLNDFYDEYKDRCTIILIYISEAHAADVWNIGLSAGTINYSHKTIEDRLQCVNKFVNEFNIRIPVYADNMNDEFETKFAAWPIRYYIIENGKFLHIGQPSDSTFDMTEIFTYI